MTVRPYTRRPAPTVEQMLNLADRAERGPLSATEAAWLRTGIHALVASQRSASRRLAQAGSGRQQLAAVRRLVRRAGYRGAATVTVWALNQVLTDAQPTTSAADAVSRPHRTPQTAERAARAPFPASVPVRP